MIAVVKFVFSITILSLCFFVNVEFLIVLIQVVLLDNYASEYDLANINGYTGMGVSLIIMVLGLYMIIGVQKHLVPIE